MTPKTLEERINILEDIVLDLGKILTDQNEAINLLSKENDIMKELIELKSSEDIIKIKKRIQQTYFT